MFKNLKKCVLGLLCVMLMAGTSVTAGDGPKSWPKVIKVGVIPTEGGNDSKERFQPLKNHLKSTLGIDVEIVSASDYAGVITAMQHKHIDFAYFGPKSYTEAAKIAGAEAIALELDTNRAPGYYGIIIAKKGSGITKLDQIKGKTFCFTDPNSTSGCLVPSVLFARDLKVDPKEYFKEVSFSGSHGASILAVKNDKVQVAATNDIDMGRMVQKGAVADDDFVILWKSELIPGAPIAARKDLPGSLKAAVSGALMQLSNKSDVLAKLGNGGYQFADDTTYDVIRYLKRLKKQLQEKQG